MPPNPTSFLPHVAGLRAIAIILVVLFHLDGSAWAHGYLGVDVFLVISGYMLFRARIRQNEPYGIKDTVGFLYKRGMRIVPPMVVTILLTIALGILLMGAEDLAFLCGLGGYSLVGAANFSLRWSFEDYFAQDAAFIPLLHFWYLAVILQVYMLWAVGNYLIQRLSKGMVIAVLVALGLASLAYCYSFSLHEWLKGMGISWWEQEKAPSYYQTLPRVWEILAGGLICVLPSVRKRAITVALSLIGLLCILQFSLNSSIPGGGISWISELPANLFVVVGTILLIRYLPESGLNKLLANAPLVWLGGISFSIYLVHMPIIFFWKLWQFGQMDTWDKLGAFLLSIPLGYAFWWCIEKRRFTWWLAILLWCSAIILCFTGRRSGGFRFAFGNYFPIKTYDRWQLNTDSSLEIGLTKEIAPSHTVFVLMNLQDPYSISLPTPLMRMGSYEKKPSILLIGDSHASHLYSGLDHVMRREKLSGIYLSSMAIPLHHCVYTHNLHGEIDPAYNINPEKEDALMHWLEIHPELKHVIIAQSWLWRYEQFNDICRKNNTNKDLICDLRSYLHRLAKMKKNVIIIGSTPRFDSSTSQLKHYYKIQKIKGKQGSDCTTGQFLTAAQHTARCAHIISDLKQMENEGLCTVIEPLNALSPEENYFSYSKNGVLYMSDSNHMTPSFSIWLVERLWSQILGALKE